MKIKPLFVLVTVSAMTGLLIISLHSLQTLRNNLLESKKDQILKVIHLSTGVLEHYHKLEVKGQLAREQAQQQAREALSGLRFGDDYLFVRRLDNVMLVHGDPNRVGKVDRGSPTEDGRLTSEVYPGLRIAPQVFMVAQVARPSDHDKKQVPKMLGAVLYKPWDWVVGNGVFIDDIDHIYWAQAFRLIGMDLAILAILAAVGFYTTRSIQRQLGGEPAYAVSMAHTIASGQLNAAIVVDGPPSSVLAAISHMQSQLRQLVLEVKQRVLAVEGAAQNMAHSNQTLCHRTEKTAASLEETSASLEQLAVNLRQTAEATEQAHHLAQEASTIATEGGDVVNRVVLTMGAISESSRQVDAIVGVIDSIAFRTNILALNAAVEAARAGEQGRGFAVVAAEVRTLAQRSAHAAKEIKDLISESGLCVANGAAQVSHAGQSMAAIVLAVHRLVEVLSSISASTQLQSQHLSEIEIGVSQLDVLTQQNAHWVEQGTTAATHLSDQAQYLTHVMGTLRC